MERERLAMGAGLAWGVDGGMFAGTLGAGGGVGCSVGLGLGEGIVLGLGLGFR